MQKCYQCGGDVQSTLIEKYHYTECGLNDIYLSGIRKYVCQSCGEEFIELPRLQQLHRTLGQKLCLKKDPLTGREVAFLRKEMRKSGKEFALMLRTSAEHLSRIEHDQRRMSGALDTLVRALYTIYVCEGLVVSEGALDAVAGKREDEPRSESGRIELTPADWLTENTVCCTL